MFRSFKICRDLRFFMTRYTQQQRLQIIRFSFFIQINILQLQHFLYAFANGMIIVIIQVCLVLNLNFFSIIF